MFATSLELISLLRKWSIIEKHRCYSINGSILFLLFIKNEIFLIKPIAERDPNLTPQEDALLFQAVSNAIKQDPDLSYTIFLTKGERSTFSATVTNSYQNTKEQVESIDQSLSLLYAYLLIKESGYNKPND